MSLKQDRIDYAKAIRILEPFEGKNVNQMGAASIETLKTAPNLIEAVKHDGQKRLVCLARMRERLANIEETIHAADRIDSDPDFALAVELAEKYAEVSARLKAAHGYDWERIATRTGIASRLPQGWVHAPRQLQDREDAA